SQIHSTSTGSHRNSSSGHALGRRQGPDELPCQTPSRTALPRRTARTRSSFVRSPNYAALLRRISERRFFHPPLPAPRFSSLGPSAPGAMLRVFATTRLLPAVELA